MNPHANSSAKAQAFTFYCNERGLFECPISDCTKSYRTPESTYYHINKTHVSWQNPHNPQNLQNLDPQDFAPGPPRKIPSPTLQTAPLHPVPAVRIPHNRTITWPSSQIRKVSAITSRTPSPLSQSQPLSIPHDTTSSEQQQDWSESISWPPQTISLLKSLVVEAGLFMLPQTPIEHNKLLFIFQEFYKRVDFPNYKPHFQDQRLWLLFKSKVHELRIGMLQSGELYKTKEGLGLSKLPTNILHLDAPSKGTPISTPPRTPSLPPDQHQDGLVLWSSLDSAAQAKLFHEIIRTAKSPQSLILEWEEYSAEARRKEPRADNIPKRASAQAHVFSSTSNQSPITPIDTPPPPQPSKPTDLKSLIELRLQEASLKRKRAKEAEQACKESASKKVKSEP